MTLAYLKLFADQVEELGMLDDAARGRFVMGLMLYATQGIVPEFTGEERFLWPSFRRSIDAAAAQVEAQTANGSKGGRPRKTETQQKPEETQSKPNESQQKPNESQEKPIQVQVHVQEQVHVSNTPSNEGVGAKAPSAPARKRFTPPTVDEVAAYAKEKGLELDADRFCDFYAAKGWQVGKNPMKDWQAAVRNWARGETSRGSPQPKQPKVVRDQQYEQRPYENSPDIPDWMMARWNEMQKDQPKPARQPKMVREQMYNQREYTNTDGPQPWLRELSAELYGRDIYSKETTECATL